MLACSCFRCDICSDSKGGCDTSGLEESVEHFFSQRNGFKGEQSLPSDGAREMNGNGGETHKRSPGEDLQASGSALDPLAALEQGEGDKVDLRRLA